MHTLTRACYAAGAPFHILKGEGLALLNEFLSEMQNIVNPPDTAASIEDAAVRSYEAHLRRASSG